MFDIREDLANNPTNYMAKKEVFEGPQGQLSEIFYYQSEPVSNRAVFFGPCKTSVYDLFDQGFTLGCLVHIRKLQYKRSARFPLYLSRQKKGSGIERYKVTNLTINSLNNASSLCGFIRDGINLVDRYAPPKDQKDIEDIWSLLHEKYPKKPTKDIMVGNMTIEEYIKSLLPQRKRLDTELNLQELFT